MLPKKLSEPIRGVPLGDAAQIDPLAGAMEHGRLALLVQKDAPPVHQLQGLPHVPVGGQLTPLHGLAPELGKRAHRHIEGAVGQTPIASGLLQDGEGVLVHGHGRHPRGAIDPGDQTVRLEAGPGLVEAQQVRPGVVGRPGSLGIEDGDDMHGPHGGEGLLDCHRLALLSISFLWVQDTLSSLKQPEKRKILYFRPKQLIILSNCCISSPPFSGGFLLGGGGGGGPGGGGGRGTPRRRESSSARVGGSSGPTQRTYCSTPRRPRSARTCSARTRAQVNGWGGGIGGPGGQSGRF